jgi:hypothetical protein
MKRTEILLKDDFYMSKEVACRVLAPVLEAIQNKKLPTEIWLRKIPYSIEYLQKKHERIEWRVLYQLMKNVKSSFSDDDFEAIGRSWAKNPLFRPWAIMMSLYFNKERYFKWARQNLQKAGNVHFSCIDFNLEELNADGFKVTLTLKDGYPFCREYFLIVKGAMELLPRFRGYSTVDVTLTWIKRGAVYENIFYRKAITDYHFMKKISRVFNAWATFRELNEAHEALMARYQELEKARVIEKQQTLQIQTAYEICQAIRRGLNLYFTLNAIVRALVEIAGFAAAEIYISTDTEGNPLNKTVFQGKIPSKIPHISESLTVGRNDMECSRPGHPRITKVRK